MSDRAALLAAIRMHPDEDTPRLVFADWLDEHGESERAEFIRLQVRLARHPRGKGRLRVRMLLRDHRFKVVGAPAFSSLFEVEKGKHDGRLLGSFAEERNDAVFRTAEIGLARGFIESVRCPACVWLRHADAILAEHPVLRVTLTTHWTWDDFDSVPGDDGMRVCTFTLSAGGEQFRVVRRIALEDMRAKYNAELVWPGIQFDLPPAPALNAADWLAGTIPALPYTLTGTSS